MTKTWKRFAYLAIGTVTVAGMTGAFGSAAFAADDDAVPSSGAGFDAYAQSVLVDDAVQAVAKDGDGNVVIYTTTPVDQIDDASMRSLVESKSNVVVKVLAAPLEAYDVNDVVGGAGYLAYETPESTLASLCSIGFSAWTPAGDPAVISAGHCTEDGARVLSDLTLPTGDPAGGGRSENEDVTVTQALGTLGFSQYGGPGNTGGTAGDKTSVDISTIDIDNAALTLLPEVTDWTTSASEDLSASTLPVRSVGTASVGASVSKSGRTTGFSSGTVESVDGWANVGGRQVYGFMTVMESKEGDSGGSIIQGDAAVGIVSGGSVEDGIVWGADLQAGLALTGGYTVALQLDAPVLTSPADGGDVYTGAAITGTGPAGGTLVVDPTPGDTFEVPVDGSGNWTFPAPGQAGPVSYSVFVERGFDTSPTTVFDVNVVPAPLKAPAITSPFNGQQVETSISALSGTGEPGATVTLTGSVDETALVGPDGTWSVDVELGYGSYSVSAVQNRVDASTSPSVTAAFTVVPVAPAITSPTDGSVFDAGNGPTQVTGTGIDGARVTVTVNGAVGGYTTVVDGKWVLPLAAEENPAAQLPAGAVTFSATQTIDGATGAAATSTITIKAAAGGGSTTAGGPGAALANTGAPVAPLLGGGVLLLLAAGGLLMVARRARFAQRNN
ncbi:hypothetical protein ACEXQE_17300 [Herbiconiux sp. P17]|uniref:hypothetical protein n=1 Tax=Herbiconiux wuyangfengii TaxID=3342794 RepID=UPI0035B92DB1